MYLFIYVLIVLSSGQTDNLCGFRNKSVNITFDLAPLSLISQLNYYTIRSKSDVARDNYTYFLNFCRNVRANPPCANFSWIGTCPTANGTKDAQCSELRPISNPAAAYQMRNNHQCYRVSDDVPLQSASWTLLDPLDPASGVQVTFNNGDYCKSTGRNRKLEVGFVCSDADYGVPDERVMEEGPTCVYSFNVSTIHGCPAECGRMNNKLCNGTGLCEFDWTNNFPRCFCFHGSEGFACNQPSKDTPPPPIQVKNSKCSWSKLWKGNVNVTFDLEPFDVLKKNETFKFHNLQESSNYHHDFYVNFCEDIPLDFSGLPRNCSMAKGPCYDLSKPCNSTLKSTSGVAYQQDVHDRRCWMLGQARFPHYSLLDEQDPTKGVVVEYTGGGYGDCNGHPKNRSIIVKLICPDSSRQFFDPEKETRINETISEPSTCTYELRVETAFACPKQCQNLQSDGKLTICSGRGVCAADPQAGYVRCLCDKGWTGQSCEKKVMIVQSPNVDNNPHTGWKVAVALLTIVLIGVALFSAYIFVRKQAVESRLDTLRRQILDEDPDDVTRPYDEHIRMNEVRQEDDGVGHDTRGLKIATDEV